MKFAFYTVAFVVVAACLTSCQDNKKEVVEKPVFNVPDKPVWIMNPNDFELGTKDFETFDIERDYTKLNEALWTNPTKKQYVENTQFTDSINISYTGNRAIINCKKNSAFSVKANGAHVVINTKKDIACTLSGKSQNGSLEIVGDGKVRINLKGITLHNNLGPAISNHSHKECFLVADSASELSDNAVYAEVVDSMMPKGCVYCKGKLAISGEAPLKIIANGADAIHSAKSIFIRRCTNIDIESHASSAIKAKNKVMIEGGRLNINSTGQAGHGIAADKEVKIAGGRTVIISNTGYGKDRKNSRGIKSDSLVAITGGIVRIKESSFGGKGIRSEHAVHVKNCILDILTYGNDDKHSDSKNRGIRGVDEIRIDSSRVRIRCERGNSEALSSAMKIIINNSLVELTSRDDAISAGNVAISDIEVTNSRVYANAGRDAFDSNGMIHINSGLFFVMAQHRIERAFDCDCYEFKIGPKAIVVGIGNVTSHPKRKLLVHPACFITRPSVDKQFCVTAKDKDENLISFNTPEFWYPSPVFKVLLSLPEFQQGEAYDFCNSAVVKPKHTFHGLQIGGKVENKVVTATHKLKGMYYVF